MSDWRRTTSTTTAFSHSDVLEKLPYEVGRLSPKPWRTMPGKSSRGSSGPTVDLLRADPENDEELAAWLDSMNPEQRTRMLLSSVRGVSQGGPRNRNLGFTSKQNGNNANVAPTDGNRTCRSTPALQSQLDFNPPNRRPATVESRFRVGPFDVEAERKKLAALQVARCFVQWVGVA